MSGWKAEHSVDEAAVRQLLGQFPELAIESLTHLSEGWDRSAWLVNGRLVFGFPRRAVVVPGLERELTFLSRLAPLLPLPIPVPLYVGRPADDYPWPFFGSALVPGQESGEAELDDSGRTRVAVELAGFLRRLHSAAVAEALDADSLPVDGNERAEMAARVPLTRASLTELDRLGLWQEPGTLPAILREAEGLPSSAATSVVHGDLHFRHLLVDRGHASGVIDWIDLCRGDPAIDLQVFWSFVPAAGRRAFLAAYGAIRDDQLLRARVVAVSLSAQLALYGHAEGLATIKAEALGSLARAMSE
ncbi:MAG TPA: phosphotransferase [Gaiellaceae bacterium]|jgi:aminoglycoside phosphotransferase (APT) family kinase protein|nr:phosphotransferase [Gaiellaceae bacterium]